jgi:hypothetical protein
MGLRIFETDPGAAPKPRFADDIVGRFRSGYQVNGRPATLEAWRVTTGDPKVATALLELLEGDEAQEWDTRGEDNLEIFTKAQSVKILLEPSAIRTEMVLWGRAGAIRKCDGVEQMGENAGKACECPHAFAERKEAAKRGTGCQPSIGLVFRLADAPDLGKFRFSSGSWSLVKDIGAVEAALEKVEGTAVATLTLTPVEFESGGQQRRFVKPVIDIIGSVE